MIRYAILTGLFRVYGLGVILAWVNALSVLIFSSQEFKPKWERVGGMLTISFIWPVAIFSPEGRNILLGKIKTL